MLSRMLYVQSTSSPIPVVLFMFKSMFIMCTGTVCVLTGAIELSVLYYLLVCLARF